MSSPMPKPPREPSFLMTAMAGYDKGDRVSVQCLANRPCRILKARAAGDHCVRCELAVGDSPGFLEHPSSEWWQIRKIEGHREFHLLAPEIAAEKLFNLLKKAGLLCRFRELCPYPCPRLGRRLHYVEAAQMARPGKEHHAAEIGVDNGKPHHFTQGVSWHGLKTWV